ncbi:MAG: M55 family metallopeptidase [Hyphomicrobiales bacterium]|nr:M55 family metallopeptidase [Hyphomicrobiales bacterium]
MRIFISVDMEGTTGLERLEEIFRGLPGFDKFRQLMAGDANAVIQGAIEGGATEIVVSDSHGYMCNIYPDDLIKGVQLKRGQIRRQWCQMKTFDRTFDAAILVGYHAKAGTEDGILAHTWITGFKDVRVNGQSVPEPSLNTWLAGSFGAPVVMLSGDNYVIEQAMPVMGDIEYAQLKTSTGFFSGDHLAIDKTRPLLRETAARAVANAGKIAPVACELPVTIEVDLSADAVNDPALGQRVDDNTRFIDVAWEMEKAALSDVDLILATHPETSSPKTGTISFTCGDYQTAYRTLHSILLEIYERDIENLIDDISDVAGYARPGLDDIVYPDYPLNEIGGRA